MNKLTLKGTVWIASDIHLGPDNPATAQVFFQFLKTAAEQADALLLCGDIFEAWIGDDLAIQAPPAWLQQATHELQQAAARIPLWIGRGNRDFLLDKAYAQHLGAQLLPDSTLLATDNGKVLLSHGDEYCTDDVAYQRFRRWVRRPWLQRLFLGLSLKARTTLAAWARQRSRQGNKKKMEAVLDVSDSAIRQAFERSGVRLMVHGHTHRPAVHHYTVNHLPCTRLVLPDWDAEAAPPRGGWICINSDGIELHQNPSHTSSTPPKAIRYQANGR